MNITTAESAAATKIIADVFDECINFQKQRSLHGWIMIIVFIVLFPMGAISMHLPLKIRVVPYIHAPIQVIGVVLMMIGAALGVSMTSELHLWNPFRVHVTVGLLAAGTILLMQPALGIIQHRYFQKTGRDENSSSIFGVMHRWIGRVAVILGMVNCGLGFQLAEIKKRDDKESLISSLVLMGVLVPLWLLALLIGLGKGRFGAETETEDGEARSSPRSRSS
ncbi:hypothetical protein AJ79_04489 [Helicocarpus griseus UAMH5409]|uniref:Cytochrome b561 domain-containing protein n=1 Tax=Helicocarpus griseus UAMH5409 TaxID=1447875 RepID=A0A2B7XSX3_9EURO|nr:hypothetical protein AJ79_04489 [Helicocarpus griseus UAMH5409]